MPNLTPESSDVGDSPLDVQPSRPRTVFTDDALEMIKRMVEMRRPVKEIAEAVGTSVESLKASCSRLGVSLRHPALQPTMEGKRPLKLFFEDTELNKLNHAAQRRGTSTTNLIHALVVTILNDGLINAVLDDER